MNTKQIWRLLEPGKDVWQDGDEIWHWGEWVKTCNFKGIYRGPIMDGMVRRLETIQDESPWIPLSERRPSKEDANQKGYVLFTSAKTGACYVAPWNYAFMEDETHWQAIAPTPKIIDPEQEAWEKEKAAMIARDPTLPHASIRWDLAESAFLAGRRSMRNKD